MPCNNKKPVIGNADRQFRTMCWYAQEIVLEATKSCKDDPYYEDLVSDLIHSLIHNDAIPCGWGGRCDEKALAWWNKLREKMNHRMKQYYQPDDTDFYIEICVE